MDNIPQSSCLICKESGHHSNNCPELTEPLKNGFYSGGTYGGGGEGEDDD
jgi:hypothetical protein